MSDRKQTPNVLADLLGGNAAGIVDPGAARRAPRPKPAAARTATPAGARKAGDKAPARWEHCVASFQQHKGWRLRYLDGVEASNWASGPLLPEFIAAQAAEGWQMAAACSGEALFGNLDKYQVYFKRPI